MKFTSIADHVLQRQNYSGNEYLLHTIAYHLAPVVEGHKPAIILSFNNSNREMMTLWDRYKEKFPATEKLNYWEVKRTKKAVSVFFYNHCLLKQDIGRYEVRKFMEEFGYNEQMSIEEALAYLSSRFNQGCPHEIGVFLGIPLADVVSFIQHEGKNCLDCGYWKVYHNHQEAKTTFALYEEAKYKFMQFIKRGNHPGQYLGCQAS